MTEQTRGFRRGIRKLLGTAKEFDDELVLFRCTECGKVSFSLGWLHAHIESHRPWYLPFTSLIPFIGPSYGDFDVLMESTQVIRITSVEVTELDRVNGIEQGNVNDDTLNLLRRM